MFNKNLSPQEEMEQLLEHIKYSNMTVSFTDQEYFEEDTLQKIIEELEILKKTAQDKICAIKDHY